MMNKLEDQNATARREAGKAAWHKDWPTHTVTRNPYAAGTFEHYCWGAGYQKDVRSNDELHRDWLRGKARKG